MARALIPVDVIVADLCEQLGDSNERFDLPVRKALLRAYKKVFLLLGQSFDTFKTVIAPTSQSYELPCDFITETKVGIKRGNTIAILSLATSLRKNNNSARMSQSDSLVALQEVFDYWTTFPCYTFYNYNGGCLTGYGDGVSSGGFYNIDRASGTLELGSLIEEGDELIVEYKSNGIGEGFELVPDEMAETLRYFAKAIFYEDRNPNLSAVNMRRYQQEYNQLKKVYEYVPLQFWDRIFERQQTENGF